MEITSKALTDANAVILKISQTHSEVELMDPVTGLPSGKAVGTAHILYRDQTTDTIHCETVAVNYEAYPEPEFDHTDNVLSLEEAKKLLDQAGISY